MNVKPMTIVQNIGTCYMFISALIKDVNW